MFNIDDSVVHTKTGNLGKICGYGHAIIDNSYLPTLKVLLTKKTEAGLEIRSIVEDLYREWIPEPTKPNSELNLSNQPTSLFPGIA
jgi:hypothetical protein